MYSTIPTITISSKTFHLVKNGVAISQLRLLMGLGIFLIPTYLVNTIFASIFHLTGVGLAIATALVGLLLLNLTLFLLNRTNRGNKTLIIGFNHFRFIENTKEVQIIPFEKITIIKFKEENDGVHRQVVIQSTVDFPDMIIKAPIKSSFWKMSKNKTNISINHKIYFIKTNEEWLRLIQVLNHFIVSDRLKDLSVHHQSSLIQTSKSTINFPLLAYRTFLNQKKDKMEVSKSSDLSSINECIL